jgi:hypothetical protein
MRFFTPLSLAAAFLFFFFAGFQPFSGSASGTAQAADPVAQWPPPFPSALALDREGPASKVDSTWQGQQIGRLVAFWGKPVRIAPAAGLSGQHDYLFESYERHEAYIPPRSINSSRSPLGFNSIYSAGAQPVENDAANQLECRAVVRVDNSRRVVKIRFENNLPCVSFAPFGQASQEVPNAQ